MPRSRHTPEVKQHAIELYVEHGAAEASRLLATEGHEITAVCIRSWASRGGYVTVAGERTRAAREAGHLRWEARRTGLCDRMGQVAEKALTVIDEALDAGKTRQASDASATLARLVDKAQLLSGGATGRQGTEAERGQMLTEAHGRALELVTDAA